MLIQNPLNSSELAFPILECFHIVGFAIGIGTIAIVDFRLLGIGLRHQSSAQLTKDTSLWTLISLSIAIFAGLLLFTTDPDKYYLNLSFVFKITALVLAILFNYTIHRKVAFSNPPPGQSWLVACVSLVLWASVIFGGIFIAFVGEGLNFD
jgi:hypothetical protein